MKRFISNWKRFVNESAEGASASVSRFTLKDICEESGHNYSNLGDCEQFQDLYEIFRSSYEKATGSAWTKDLFLRRAQGWTFFGRLGKKGGVVAIRRQRSGLNKLAGNPRSVLGAMNLLQSELGAEPIWGAVSNDLVPMAERKGLMTVPTFVKKASQANILTKYLPVDKIIETFGKVLLNSIPKSVFGGYDVKPNSDGSMEVEIAEMGMVKKYLIGNEEYYRSTLTGSDFLAKVESMDKSDPIVSMAIKMLKSFFSI